MSAAAAGRQIKCLNCSVLLYHCRTNEMREKITMLQDEIQQLNMDIEENQGIGSFVHVIMLIHLQ